MINGTTQTAIQGSLEWLARQQHVGGQDNSASAPASRQRGRHQPGGPGLHGGRPPARPRPLRPGRHARPCGSSSAGGCAGPSPASCTTRPPAPHGPMYGHGFATLFLAEVYGMVHEPRAARPSCAAKLSSGRSGSSSSSQNHEGGWRYTPVPHDADLSVTICQIMALRRPRTPASPCPRSTVDNCISTSSGARTGAHGGFRYQAGGRGGTQGFARTAAGVVALYSAGIYEGPEIDAGLRYLSRYKPARRRRLRRRRVDMHYFYGHYYAVQAMWTAGGRLLGGVVSRHPRRVAHADQGPTAPGTTRSAPTTARRWRASSCRCPTTTCRSCSMTSPSPRMSAANTGESGIRRCAPPPSSFWSTLHVLWPKRTRASPSRRRPCRTPTVRMVALDEDNFH